MTALYFHVLRPEDRVAVKPHASPVFHAIQYLLGNQTRDKLQNFRGFGGAQSYPSRTKDVDDVDFSTGSVGLGVAQTLFCQPGAGLRARQGLELQDRPEGRMIALMGDAEIDEGNIHEALLEGWKHGLRNTWWVVDYNRQSLDAVVRDGLCMKFAAHVPEPRLEGRDHQVRQAAAGGVRRARRRALQELDRRLPEPALLGAGLPGRRGVAQAAGGRPRRSGAGHRD